MLHVALQGPGGAKGDGAPPGESWGNVVRLAPVRQRLPPARPLAPLGGAVETSAAAGGEIDFRDFRSARRASDLAGAGVHDAFNPKRRSSSLSPRRNATAG